MQPLKLTGLVYLFLCSMGCDILPPEEAGNLVPKTVTEDSALPSFELSDGTRLHLEEFGDPTNPLLIVLHGGPGGDYRSYLALKGLSDQFHMILWDQRGAGLSQRVPEAGLTGPQYLADLHELGLYFSPDEPFYLLGHSWGGCYATYYVNQYPDRVARLVLIEPGALTVAAAKKANSMAMAITEEDLNRYVMMSDYLLPDGYAKEDYFFAVLLANSNSLDDFSSEAEFNKVPFWRHGFLANKGINDWQGNFDEPTFDVLTDLTYENPTIIIGGNKSKRLGFEFQETYHAPYFHNPELVELDGAGHYSPHFNSEQLLPIIREFLSSERP